MLDIIDTLTGKYVTTSGVYEDKPIRSHCTPERAYESYSSTFNLTMKSILTISKLDGHISETLKDYFKSMNRPISIVDENKKVVKEYAKGEFLKTQDSIAYVSEHLEMNYQFVEDYILGKELGEIYADVIFARDQFKYSSIKKICEDQCWSYEPTDDGYLVSIRFKDEDDLMLWKMSCSLGIADFIQYSVYDLIYKIKRLESLLDYPLRGNQ